MKRKEIYAQDAGAINATIAGFSRNLYFREIGLPEHALAEPLERIGFNRTNDVE